MTIVVSKDGDELAVRAARLTAQTLNEAIAAHGQAVWVLAGGTAPMGTYAVLAREYHDAVEWPKVWVLLGDERAVPADDAEATWRQIDEALLRHIPLTPEHTLRPLAGVSAEEAARHYEQALQVLPKNAQGVPRFDLLWVGMGEDGHTLSLFPGHPELAAGESLVVPVHDSPKPPADRFSLTLHALTNVGVCVVLTAGSGKAEALKRALQGDQTLPIALAMNTVSSAGGSVIWMIDAAAAAQLPPELLQ